MRRFLSEGLSFLELMVAVLLLAVIFLYLVPVFLSSSRYTFQQKESLQASLFSQALLERIRESSRLYSPPCSTAPCPPPLCASPNCSTVDPYDFYTNLEYLYDPSRPYVNASFFRKNHFDPTKSYIVACPELGCPWDTSPEPVGSATSSKKIVIHLVWDVPAGEASPGVGTYTLVTRIARPPGWFPLNPQVITYPTTTTTSVYTTSTTSVPTTSASTTSTTSRSTTRTTSRSTTRTTSVATTSASTTSTTSRSTTRTTSRSTTSTTSVATTSASTTSTTSTSTTSMSTTTSTSFQYH